MATLFLAVCAGGTLADFDNRPIVVFRIDDCSSTWATPFAGLGGMSALQYGTLRHIPITWAVIAGKSDAYHLTWQQIKSYLDANGGEAASHSVNHCEMATQQGYINEVVASKAMIEANLPGYHCNTFIQPGFWTGDGNLDRYDKLDNPIGQAIQANYARSMGYLGAGWTIGDKYYKYGDSAEVSLDARDAPTIPQISALLDVVANTPGLTITLKGHEVQETNGNAALGIRADLLKATMDKLADLRDQGRIRLMGAYEAMCAHFSDDLNHVPDPGFEVIDPTSTRDPWRFAGGSQIVSGGGNSNSRYCSLPSSSAYVYSCFLTLPPGRYEMSWCQKVTSGKQACGLAVMLNNMYATDISHASSFYEVNWKFYYNTHPDTWERRTALVLVRDHYNRTQLRFQPAPGGSYGLDDVSIVPSPLDPAVSPSQSFVTPSPGQCTISWKTPVNPGVTSVMVRWDSTAYPIVTNVGSLLGVAAAQHGATQQITVPYDWTVRTYAYFSVFGTTSDGGFTPPDVAAVKVDRTPPGTPVVNCWLEPGGNLHAQWTCSEPDSGVAQYQYAVGTSPGSDNIRRWTYTTQANVIVAGAPTRNPSYISVRAQNAFGFWSDHGSAPIPRSIDVAGPLVQPDGRQASVSGLVTAVFSDCYYVQDPSGARGIKIIGNTSGVHLGDQVTVTGTLTTVNGERCIQL